MILKKRISQIKKHIFLRPYPHAVLSWRYLLPRQSKATLQHKKVFLQAWSMLPRSAWAAIAIYSTSKWYLWGGWKSLYHVFFNYRPKQSATTTTSKSVIKQFSELWWLTFANSIPPHYYYDYQLYRFAEKDWLNFIYEHELPHWHRTLSPNMTAKELELITDKQLFSEEILKAGLAAIPTLHHLKPSDEISNLHVFQERSLFIKPVVGSQKRDCYELLWEKSDMSYRLLGNIEIANKQEILTTIQELLSKKAIIVQPLLRNHHIIESLHRNKPLAVIRLITAMKANKTTTAVDAILQIPLDRHSNRVVPYRIDIESGMIKTSPPLPYRPPISQTVEWLKETTMGTTVPMWPETIRVAKLAHNLFPNIHTIGWDLCVTPSGVVIIEGNFNWGVWAHQIEGTELPSLYTI